jgi:transcriptional regulator with XRE-family HTH domain
MRRYTFNADAFARAIREKRGHRSLRAITSETGISPSTLSRVEQADREKPPDMETFTVLCGWMERNPAEFLTPTVRTSAPISLRLIGPTRVLVERAVRRLKNTLGESVSFSTITPAREGWRIYGTMTDEETQEP